LAAAKAVALIAMLRSSVRPCRGSGFSLLPADVPLPPHPAIRSVPLIDPTPLYAWSLLWRGNGGHPLLDTLTSAFVTEAERNRWLEYDPTRDWLPERHSTDAGTSTPS
jgi:hypothetical protein